MKWLFAFFSIIVVLLVGLAVAPSFFDWNQYKEPAIQQVKQIAGLDVKVEGDVSLALLPSPRVYLEKVSVADPREGVSDNFASFDVLDVRVGLLPLFKGQAQVHSVHLEKPVVSLHKNAEGRFNFVTPKIQAMMDGKKALGGGSQSPKAQKFKISFEEISIEDGAFTYSEAGKKQKTVLSDVNLDVQAKSLQGPFNGEGSFKYNGDAFEFDGKTGAVDMALKTTSVNLEAQGRGVDLQYAGIVAFGDAPEIQGETSIRVASLADLTGGASADSGKSLKGALLVEGVVSANKERVALKNSTLSIDGKKLTGEAEATLSPISVKGAFAGQDILNLDAFIGKGAQKKSDKGFDPLSLGAALPRTLEILEVQNVDLSLSMPGVILNGQVLKGVKLKVQNTDKTFAGVVDVGELPGNGQVKAQGALSFAEKSKSTKTGKVIYSDPVFAYEVNGQTQNLPVMVGAMSGMSGLPLVKDAKRGVFEFKGKVSPTRVALDKGVMNIDDAAFALSGSFSGQKGTERSLLTAKIVADQIDFDTLFSKKGQSAGGDPAKVIQSLKLPYDVKIDVAVNDAVLKGYEVKGLKGAATILPNSLKVTNAGADNFVNSKLNVSASVGNLSALSGLDVAGSIDTPDPYKLADALGVDTKKWPQDLGATKARMKASGDLERLNVDADVAAFGGEVGIIGVLSDPLTEPKMNNLKLKIDHPNMAKAIRTFAPGAPNYASLAKPMSLRGDLSMNGKMVSLQNIQADFAGAKTTGGMKIDSNGAKPSIFGTLRIGDLVLKSGAHSGGGSSGGGASSKSSAGGKWSSASMNNGWLHAANMNLDIAANSVVYETWNLSKPSLKMTMQNGALNIEDLKSGLYDGQIAMNGVVSSSAPSAPLSVKINSAIDNINMGALAKALADSGRIDATGDVSLDFNISGQGASQKVLVNSLSGKANLSGNKVVMKGFDLAGLAGALMESNKPLPRVQQILGASTRSGETAFDTVKGAYDIAGGVVNITDMQMDGPEALIVSKGNVSLPRWYMDTTHTITLRNADEVDPFDVAIKGSLDNPSNTFGSGLFDTFVRQRLQGKLAEELPGLLGDDVTDKLQQFGILPQAKKKEPQPENIEPAANDNAPAPEQDLQEATPQKKQEPQRIEDIKPEEVVEDLLKGFLQ